MPTKNMSNERRSDELRQEYALDYSKAKANRFAVKLKDTTVVVLQPDVAKVFRSAKAVNDLLRSAITTTGAGAAKPQQGDHSEKASGRHAG